MKYLVLIFCFFISLAQKASAQTSQDTTIWGDIAHNFPGGQQAYVKYINKSVLYPAVAYHANVQGCTYLKITIDPDSTLSDIKIYAGIGSGADEESLRVFKNGKKWIPGKLNGVSVKTWVIAPINFHLEVGENGQLAPFVFGAPGDSVSFATLLAFESSGISLAEAKGYMHRHINFVGKVQGVKKLSDTLLLLTCSGLYSSDYVNIALMGPAVQPEKYQSLPGYYITGNGTVTRSGGTPIIIITDPKDYALKENL